MFERNAQVESVYRLPKAFEGTRYDEGIISISVFWSVGLSVVIDRGMIALQGGDDAVYHFDNMGTPF